MLKKIIGISLILFLAVSCSKDDSSSEKIVLFEEIFDGNHNWSISLKIDSIFGKLDDASGEINNGQLYLDAKGCSEVSASFPFTSTKMTTETYKSMTIFIGITEFFAHPKISHRTKIDLAFKDFYLSIKPKQNLSNLLLIFNVNENGIELVNETDAIEYSFSTNSNHNGCDINIESIGGADCYGTSHLKLSSIKVFAK